MGGTPLPEKHRPTDEQQDDRPPFEDVVAALLQVDPKGIAGKHRKVEPEQDGEVRP